MRPFDPGTVPPALAALTLLGTVIAMLGLLLAGDQALVGLGLGAVIAAGVIGVFER
jgi:hypothetical protein